mgnify:CR=1 FL=1
MKQSKLLLLHALFAPMTVGDLLRRTRHPGSKRNHDKSVLRRRRRNKMARESRRRNRRKK